MSDENANVQNLLPPPLLSAANGPLIEKSAAAPQKLAKLPTTKAFQSKDTVFEQEESPVMHVSAAPAAAATEYTMQRENLLRQKTIDEADTHAQTLFQGGTFTKLGNYGKPKAKFIVCSQDGNLFWSDVAGGKTLTSIRLVNVTAVHKGKTTEVFQRKVAKEYPDELCFSIVTRDRTLDLVAESESIRDSWIKAILFASENVQSLGKVCRQPVQTTDNERRQRDLDRMIEDLQAQLAQSKRIIFQKTQDVQKYEEALLLEKQNSQSDLLHTEDEMVKLREEQRKLMAEQEELTQQIKKMSHERQASRSQHLQAIEALAAEKARIEEANKQVEAKSSQEKAQMTTIINESQKLLNKAKETIHKRQQSRQQRVSMIEALQREVEELRARNLTLRQEVTELKATVEQNQQDVEKARRIIAVVSKHPDLTEVLKDIDTSISKAAEVATPAPLAPRAPRDEVPPMKSISEDKEDNAVEVSISYADVLTPARWQPDSCSSECSRCSDNFTFFKRKHHCRKCGALVCGDCSNKKVLVNETSQKVRVCRACVVVLRTPADV